MADEGNQAHADLDYCNSDQSEKQLIRRVFNMLRENNPPQFLRQVMDDDVEIIFVNFMDVCKTMHRESESDHVMRFILSEAYTSGSLDGQQRLVIKGRFHPKNFEAILLSYINKYVTCNGCKSTDTILSMENNNHLFLRCQKCDSWRSVPPINRGFVADGRRRV